MVTAEAPPLLMSTVPPVMLPLPSKLMLPAAT